LNVTFPRALAQGRRKQNRVIVAEREGVLTLITKVDGLVMESADEVVGCWKDMEGDMGKVGLELGGTEDDNWFQRLEIKKKGGGFHFDDDQRALAGKAWTRLNALALLARWLGELSDKASKMVRRYSEMQANHTSRGKIVKGLGEMLHIYMIFSVAKYLH
jgi:hypothetical protein